MPRRRPFLPLALAFTLSLIVSVPLLANPPFPPLPSNSASKKGLQVQMIDDAIALGVAHAALNFNFAQCVSPDAPPPETPPAPSETVDGNTFYFQPQYLESMDRQIRTLTDAGAVVTLILLSYESSLPRLNQLLLHPKYNRSCPNHLGAFNTVTPEGRACYTAALRFLGRRWTRPDRKYGLVTHWIVGNEVNSHWFWANRGRCTLEEFADDYLGMLRLTHDALRQSAPWPRVYVSLEHHWNIHYPGGDASQTFPARPFLEYLARQSRALGDFDWHVAFHPYPENLFAPATWRDASATPSDNTPRITFKNLEQLPRFLGRDEMKYRGAPRRILLSEQGFHSPETPDGETLQAAAYCYAWKKAAPLETIDAFILHRHVDHGHEGGLRLGLWTRNPKAPFPAEPLAKKKIYQVFQTADTPAWEENFRFALPIIGISSWNELHSTPQSTPQP